MNYNHGHEGYESYGMGQPQGPSQGYSEPYPQHYQQQQYDGYGYPINPISISVTSNPMQHQQQPMYQDEYGYARRDTYDGGYGGGYAPPPVPPHQQHPPPPQRHQPPVERILRNPHQTAPIGQFSNEAYDPSLPTYNATPIAAQLYNTPQPQEQKAPIVAPNINSIFQIAAEKVSQQQQNVDPRTSSTGSSGKKDDNLPTEIITGVVSQMQDNFGMVSSEIFFQASTVVGTLPQVGDKVVVEAERVTGMPFKFNAKRVQMLSKDFIGDTDTQRREAYEQRREHQNSGIGHSRPNLDDSILDNGAQLKSILKRNPPPPPVLSQIKTSSEKKVFRQSEKYRPESPVDYGIMGSNSQSNGSFSFDLRSAEFPVILQPTKQSQIQDIYPELLYVKRNSAADKKRSGSKSPRQRRRSSSSSSRSRRSRSRSTDKERRSRRKRSPTKRSSRKKASRSRSPRRRSRSPRDERNKPRSPKRSRRSRSNDERRRSSTPQGMKRLSNSRPVTTTSSRYDDDDEIQVLGNQTLDHPFGRNVFGEKSEIKAYVVSSTLFPKIKKPSEIHGVSGLTRTISNQPSQPIAPIKFQIAPQMVPNPVYSGATGGGTNARVGVASSGKNEMLLQNPNYIPKNVGGKATNPSAIVSSVEKALKKGKKKKDEQQEPAFIIKTQPLNSNLEGIPTLEEQQARRIDGLNSSLQQMRKIEEQERLLRDQKRAIAAGIKGTIPTDNLQLQQSVEERLRNLRQRFDIKAANENGKRQEESIFMAEEKRLKAVGDTVMLSQLYKKEDRRRRKLEEDRLEKLRMDEMMLKKEKNWAALNTLRDTFGTTTERETELLRLKEMRRKEEMEEEEQRGKFQHQQINEIQRRALERTQRGSEGIVRRVDVDMDSHSRGHAPAAAGGNVRYRSRSRSPSQTRDRSRRRSPSRTPPRARGRRSSSPSPLRNRERISRRRSSSRDIDYNRVKEEERIAREKEARIRAQVEDIRRQEEELLMREREIHERMQLMRDRDRDSDYRFADRDRARY